MPIMGIVDGIIDEYKSEMVAAGLGYIATSANGRKLILDLAVTEVVYRGKQATIVSSYLGRATGLAKGGRSRAAAKAGIRAAPGALARVVSHPVVVVGSVSYMAGTAVGNTAAVKTVGAGFGNAPMTFGVHR